MESLTLSFKSPEILQVVLRAKLVPPAVTGAPAVVAAGAGGEILLSPSVSMTSKVRNLLKAEGVELDAEHRPGRAVSCWAEAFVPQAVDIDGFFAEPVIFLTPAGGSALNVCAQLLRLGCIRQELSQTPLGSLIRATEPSWYVVSEALDRAMGLRLFVPGRPSNAAQGGQVFVECGHVHPLQASLVVPAAQWLLIDRDGRFLHMPEPNFVDVSERLELEPNSRPNDVATPVQQPPRIPVRLKAVKSPRLVTPSLFILDNGWAAVEQLVGSTPDSQLENVLFAVSGEQVVLRSRPGKEAAAGELPGSPFCRLLELPNLYVPHGTALEPPLRRDHFRSWLADDDEMVYWLTFEGGRLNRHRLPEHAFQPLSAWVDYLIDRDAETLSTWARSSFFDFDSITSDEPSPSVSPTVVSEQAKFLSRAPAKSERHSKASLPTQSEESPPTPKVVAPLSLHVQAVESSELDRAIAASELAFLEAELPAESPNFRARWVELAGLYGQAGRAREAGVSWAYAFWDAPLEEQLALAQKWSSSVPLKAEIALGQNSASAEQTRSAVAHLVLAAVQGSQPKGSLEAWTSFLDRCDADLDVRSLWLGRLALSQLSGRDALGLARARDRLLTRLQRGLSIERDLPRMIRTQGAGQVRTSSERTLRVVNQLETLLTAFETTPRKRSAIEAPLALTTAYVSLEFAWGLARLGASARAQELRAASLAALDRKVPVHAYFAKAFAERIDQALEGVAPETALSADLNRSLNTLIPVHRYQVDRLRGRSVVIEPQERPDAQGEFWDRHKGKRPELDALRGVSNAGDLKAAIDARMTHAADPTLAAEERSRLMDGLIDFLPMLPESQALPLLSQFVSHADLLPAQFKVVVLEDVLKVAGHFGKTPLVRQMLGSLGNLFNELGQTGVAQIGSALVASVQSLRRVGLREEAGTLLSKASAVLKGEDAVTLQARLALAAGFSYLGRVEAAEPVIEESMRRLLREGGVAPGDRSKVARAVARALGSAPTEVALPGLLRLANQLPFVTDSFNTNEHFCLSVVDFADALVLGHVSDDLTLSETTRRFLEEDEFVVRRRVHRDAVAHSA